MSFDITRQSLFKTILYFPIMYLIFRSREYLFMATPQGPIGEMLPLGRLIYNASQSVPLLEGALSFVIVFVNSLYVTRIIARNVIFLERSYMPALIYLMVSFGYYSSGVSLVVLLAAFFILFAIDNVIDTYKQSYKLRPIFNASLAVGLATLIYAPAGAFALFIVLCRFFYRWGFRETLISLFGLTIPLFFQSYIVWGTGGDFMLSATQIFYAATTATTLKLVFSVWDYVLIAIFGGVMMLSFLTFLKWRGSGMRKHSVNAYNIFLLTLLVVVAMVALPCRSLEMMPLVAIPVAVIVPTYFNRKQGLVLNIIYAVVMWSLLIYNIIPIAKEYFML